jgi:tryptophanyl-tRNA synthetase
MGLFNYPILQSADILLYKGEAVPVGEDQVQHVELTRDIGKWFNNRYKTDFFPLTKPLLTPTARVMSLASPENKMSKSLGGKHFIGIDESPEEISEKIKKAVTSKEGIRNLKSIYEAFEDSMDGEFDEDKMGNTKDVIATGIAKHFEEFRKRKAELLEDRNYVNNIISEGQKKASSVAVETILEVKEIIGIK